MIEDESNNEVMEQEEPEKEPEQEADVDEPEPVETEVAEPEAVESELVEQEETEKDEQEQADEGAGENMDAETTEEITQDEEPSIAENEEDEKADVEETVQEEKVDAKEVKAVPPKHPYQSVLFDFKPNSWQLEKTDSQKPVPMESPFTLVDTEELLNEMMGKVKEVKELAVDVEHHSYRSYKGLVCLIQISTRTEDFIVDSIKLKDHVKVLNDVFTDANILKVLHGGDRDITWLQRDFQIYMINMFDTQRAAKVLKEEVINLARLLSKYCDVTVNKTFQIADWRERPIPEEMVTYARQDTHYLLYLYDLYRNMLLERGDASKNLIGDVYEQSTDLCRQMYVFQPDTYMRAYRKCKGHLNKRQRECFRLLHTWRNKVASEEDESTGYTLPNKMMFNIARVLPRDEKALTSCCKPMPPLVLLKIEEVRKLIEEAFKNVPNSAAEEPPAVVNKPKKPLTKKDKEQAIKNSKLKKKIKISKKQWCLECGKRGHWAKDCGEKRNQAGPQFLMKIGRGVPYGGHAAQGGPVGAATGARNFRGRGYQAQSFGTAPGGHSHGNTRPQGFYRGGINQGIPQQPYAAGMSPYGGSMNGPPQWNAANGRGMNYNMGPRGHPRMQQRPHYDPYYQW